MMKGISLTELAQKIELNRELKHDYIAPANSLELSVGGLGRRPSEDEAFGYKNEGLVRLSAPGQLAMPIRPVAHDQIGTFTNIPAKYYDRMLAEKPELLVENVNTWLRADPKKRMVRTLDGDVRAFLSNRYQRIENEEIANVALPILAEIPDVQIVSAEITERRLYIQAVSPRLQGEVARGDVVQAGVVISNSEIGLGSVSIAALDWRLRCLNGMVSSEVFRQYHVGRKIEDNADLWADDTKKADDRAVLLKVRDMIQAAVTEKYFTARLEKMQGLTSIRVEGDPAKAVEVLAKKVGAGVDEQGGILRALIEGGDLSAWGLLNAVTAQAHTAKSYDRAVEFEAAGGQLLDLSKKEWAEVLEAA
jgi:hypothetical protein